MPENSISSDVFSHWSGQEVDDKWTVIGKKRDGILENEAAIPAANDRDDENRYVEYKLDSTPFEGNKVWSSLTDARTYEPRWDIRHNVKESDVSGTEDRSLTTPEASTTAKYIVDPSNAIQDTQRVKSETFPPVVRDYSPRTWSPFNPHFASPNLGSLWGLNPNFQHNTHHFAPEKFNDMGSYPEFQFGRPSPWKPSDISYHVKNAKPKVSSEVLKTLGIKQKTILSEETLPKFLHFNGYLCPGLFGYFGDVMDCRSFFICSWGVPYRFYCPSGTLWNPVESVCDWSRNVKCSKK
ncbi:hypothetical protein C0Q70_04272 [Pomacea canaliculata]|uniref:Chitin-binding type-2 domain-containing protein n=1 Tax=Pomacea canaliculata TaxID=400727 RepID=A0A2T7PV22_POMCA|nr:uncharacterized protein LOC112557923 isoform X1 [Pomacea canaliculata]XP_025083863.1 uncharacterized protein LOC112557923 isoform X1 [Pomacea canaliculata]PVD37275.1 hypothetical protein C0Q70_04272 [Pomacea canaliculata]